MKGSTEAEDDEDMVDTTKKAKKAETFDITAGPENAGNPSRDDNADTDFQDPNAPPPRKATPGKPFASFCRLKTGLKTCHGFKSVRGRF